jgi:putative drug exporter of the RND superfamily
LVIGNERTDDELSADALESLASTDRAVAVTVGGGAAVNQDVTTQVGKSLAVAEAITVPIILVLLVFAFGRLVAALLPLAIGAVAIMGTFAELFVIGSVTNVLGRAAWYAPPTLRRLHTRIGASHA